MGCETMTTTTTVVYHCDWNWTLSRDGAVFLHFKQRVSNVYMYQGVGWRGTDMISHAPSNNKQEKNQPARRHNSTTVDSGPVTDDLLGPTAALGTTEKMGQRI
jgi:hypothetical protein